MTKFRSGPRPMSSAFDSLRDQLAPDSVLAEVQRAWPDAVGEAIAAEASPTAERGGVVTVSCSASVWAQELDLMGDHDRRAAQRLPAARTGRTLEVRRRAGVRPALAGARAGPDMGPRAGVGEPPTDTPGSGYAGVTWGPFRASPILLLI